jgi:hypothetical protein
VSAIVTLPDHRCSQLVEGPTDYPLLGGYYHCGEACGPRTTLTRSREGARLRALGRDDVDAGPYCKTHGGQERAEAEARRAWDHAAPDSVGDSGRVLEAGSASLTSCDAYVLVRRTPDEQQPALFRVRLSREQREACLACEMRLRTGSTEEGPRRQLAGALRALGLACGTLTTTEESRAHATADRLKQLYAIDLAVEALAPRLRARRRPWVAQLGIGGYLAHILATTTEDEAIEAGRRAWQARVVADVAFIRAARGGTLAWGVPIAPLAEPRVLRPTAGETGWDLVSALPRLAPPGASLFSGVRPSGEPA